MFDDFTTVAFPDFEECWLVDAFLDLFCSGSLGQRRFSDQTHFESLVAGAVVRKRCRPIFLWMLVATPLCFVEVFCCAGVGVLLLARFCNFLSFL